MTTARNDTRVTLGGRHAHLWWIRPDTLTDPAELALRFAGGEVPRVFVHVLADTARARDFEATTTPFLAGLAAGEQVVVGGQHRLHDGDRVETVPTPSGA